MDEQDLYLNLFSKTNSKMSPSYHISPKLGHLLEHTGERGARLLQDTDQWVVLKLLEGNVHFLGLPPY